MKKIIAMALALTMSLSMLAACGEEDSSSKTADTDASSSAADGSSDAADADASSEDASSDDGSAIGGGDTDPTYLEKLVSDIQESGCFTLSMDIDGEGIYITTDSANVYEEMSIFGIEVVMLVTEDGTYGIDKESKRYYKDESETSAEDVEELLAELAELANMELISTDTETIDGAEYIVEIYKDVDEYGDEYEIGFAFNDAGEMCYSYEEDEYVPYTFNATADTSKFSLDGYTEMTEDEYYELIYGDIDWGVDYDDDYDWDLDAE